MATAVKNYFFLASQHSFLPAAAQHSFLAGAVQLLLQLLQSDFFVLAQDTRDSEATTRARERIRVIEL